MIFLVRYFIGTALLVLIYILYAQKWAEGFTEPAVTDNICVYGENKYIDCIGILFIYFIGKTLLVLIHIICAQKWAARC